METKEKAKELASTLIGEDQNQQPLIDVLIEMADWQKQQIASRDKTIDYYTFENGEKHFAECIMEMIANGWHLEAVKDVCKKKINEK